MKKIHIAASKEYDILIGKGVISDLGGELLKMLDNASVKDSKLPVIAVISDDTVFSLYGDRILKIIKKSGFEAISYVFPHGERSKTLITYGRIMNFLCDNGFTRNDCVLALGGGVTGDLAGFVSATYQRGVGFIQVPTTLLAMVDSSVGGKTAVDLDRGKNQAGCFYQPSLVMIDPLFLDTLPEEEYKCGCAEIIKYAILGDESFFEEINRKPVSDQYENVINTCVLMKRGFVMEDEFDKGSRMMLNLGHSIGHAVEAASDFGILHGQAVAIGMALIAKASAKKGFCSIETAGKIVDILKKYGLPVDTRYDSDKLYKMMQNDKKMLGKTMNLIIPEKIGKCRIVEVGHDELSDFIEAAMSEDYQCENKTS